MITPVTAETAKSWAHLASQLWSPQTPELEADFLAGRFPYEFLYWDNGRAVTFMSISIRQEYVEGGSSSPLAYLEGIFVLEPYQQTGIARQLIDYAKFWARKKGLSQLASNCQVTNLVSQQVHQALGFEEVSRTVNYILDC